MIERHPGFSGPLAALAEAARVIGGHQVRNVGTIGGNVVNASPAADLLPVLLALDAEVVLTGRDRHRQLPLAAFLRGPGATVRRDDELLLRLVVSVARPRNPPPRFSRQGAGAGHGNLRRMRRGAAGARRGRTLPDRARLRLARSDQRLCVRSRRSRRCWGQPPHGPVLREAGRLAAAACTPITDVRASAEYRRMLVQSLVPRALQRCLDRIGSSLRMSRIPLQLRVNGETHDVLIEPHWTLLHVLRTQLGLTGHQGELPGGGMRRLHRAARWQGGEFLHPAGGAVSRARSILTIEGLGRPGRSASAAGRHSSSMVRRSAATACPA